jgi:hypothetical protein
MGEDILALKLGLTKMQALVHTSGRLLELHFYNGKDEPIIVTYDKDLEKTANNIKQALINSHPFNDKTERLDDFVALLTQSINDLKRELLVKAQKVNANGKGSRQQFEQQQEEESTSQDKESPPQDSNPITIALDLVEEKKVDLFLDEVKTPYALVKVNGHIETIPTRHQNFEDWVGALYYRHNKEQGHKQVLSKETIGRIQSILSFEARENDMRTLHVRVAAILDTETMCDENVVFYDLCNKNWEVVRITRNGWNVEPYCPTLLIKQVTPT